MKFALCNLTMPLFAIALLAACGERTPSQNAPSQDSQGMQGAEMPDKARSESKDDGMTGMTGMEQKMPASQEEHAAQGTVISIDAAKGSVTISHGAVASANWPAMKMTFKLADPNLAEGISAGQKVDFRFTKGSDGGATITQIVPAGGASP
jgi:Cu/Ag efflux protein CusF